MGLIIPQKRRTTKVVILMLCICFLLFVLFAILIPIIMSIPTISWMFAWTKDMTQINFKSYTDTFHVTVLEVKSDPRSFTERVRVRCEKDMEVGIWVIDLKEAGVFETRGTNGEVFYREGHPHMAGQSGPVHANDKFSTCEIIFKVTTTETNTIWHSWKGYSSTNPGGWPNDGSVDTTFSIPMTVSGVQTNWPGSYERGSEIPLANLGDYKIVLTGK